MGDLRDHLFETLEALKDPDKPMDLERAKTVSLVAQTIINSATVEVKAVQAVSGSLGSKFFEMPEESRELGPGPRGPRLRSIGAGGG